MRAATVAIALALAVVVVILLVRIDARGSRLEAQRAAEEAVRQQAASKLERELESARSAACDGIYVALNAAAAGILDTIARSDAFRPGQCVARSAEEAAECLVSTNALEKNPRSRAERAYVVGDPVTPCQVGIVPVKPLGLEFRQVPGPGERLRTFSIRLR